jgi:hypothetical protein
MESGGAAHTLAAHWRTAPGLAWNPSGKEIWFSGAQGSDAPSICSARVSGGPRSVFAIPMAASISDLLQGGRALLTVGTRRTVMICRPPGAEIERDLAWLDDSVAADISADGSAILFNEVGEAATGSRRGSLTCIRKTDGSPAIALGEGRGLGVSPDAQWAALLAPKAPGQLMLQPIAGGEPRMIERDRFTYAGAQWFPDGKRLLVWGNEEGRLRRHYVQDAAGGPMHAITPEGAAEEAAISPDGETVAAHSGPGVFLFAVDGSQVQAVRGYTEGARPAGWTADGKQLFLRRDDMVEVVNLRTGEGEDWKNLMPADPAGVTNVGHFAMTADGEAYAYSYDREQRDLMLAEGLD